MNSIVLGQRLDFAAATPLERGLESALDEDFSVDASGVEHLGGLCLEILLSGAKSAAQGGRIFKLLDPSTAFLEALNVFGVERHEIESTEGAE
ncbi:MAG: STAS domain-containing protein [Pseudomonadota bacterium]